MPIRMRLTLIFAAGTAVVLVATGLFVYSRIGASLLDTVDSGLRSRAEVIAADVRTHGPQLAHLDSNLIESDEAFAQVTDSSGQVIQSSPIVANTELLPPATVAGITTPKVFNRPVPGIQDELSRVLAEPVLNNGERFVVVAGASLQDRRDAMLQVALVLSIGGPIALVILSWVVWLLAGAALRPVERMRREASAISEADAVTRLDVPATGDELSRLATTLNEMLDRLRESSERERDFVNKASHELRTPLTVLKAELDVALSRARTADELEASLRNAAGETDRLVRLAEDLLVLARANDGQLPVHRAAVALRELVSRSTEAFAGRAQACGVQVVFDAPDQMAPLDPVRIRQALDNLIDNAIRHSPHGGIVHVSAARTNGSITLEVRDEGSGFPAGMTARAFDPFVEEDGSGAGLGLAVVRAVAEGHGGTAIAEDMPAGGARVLITFPAGS
jgi:signal transduction histidine kinase